MKLITVKLPEAYLSGIDELVIAGVYPNRSEAIRVAIRDMLKREVWVTGKPKGSSVSQPGRIPSM